MKILLFFACITITVVIHSCAEKMPAITTQVLQALHENDQLKQHIIRDLQTLYMQTRLEQSYINELHNTNKITSSCAREMILHLERYLWSIDDTRKAVSHSCDPFAVYTITKNHPQSSCNQTSMQYSLSREHLKKLCEKKTELQQTSILIAYEIHDSQIMLNHYKSCF